MKQHTIGGPAVAGVSGGRYGVQHDGFEWAPGAASAPYPRSRDGPARSRGRRSGSETELDAGAEGAGEAYRRAACPPDPAVPSPRSRQAPGMSDPKTRGGFGAGSSTSPDPVAAPPLDPFERGYLVGLLVGEGHFGGDGRQPQVTLRMHARHEELFRWLASAIPGARLYGPYHHGGRDYYQLMVRGSALREHLWPLLLDALPLLDGHVRSRLLGMAIRYGLPLGGLGEEG